MYNYKYKTKAMFENIKDLDDVNFKRLTGITKKVFELMILILSEEYKKFKSRGGRKSKISIENKLLMTLEYLREYRTYFHIGKSRGITESAAYKIICWVENTLIKHPEFALPGKKALSDKDSKYDTILIDVTETPIQRPKKIKKNIILERKKNIQ